MRTAPLTHPIAAVVASTLLLWSQGCSNTFLEPLAEREHKELKPPDLLEIVTPLDGFIYGAVDDVDSTTPGLQVPLRVEVRDLERGVLLETVELHIEGRPTHFAPVQEDGAGRFVTMPALTLDDPKGHEDGRFAASHKYIRVQAKATIVAEEDDSSVMRWRPPTEDVVEQDLIEVRSAWKPADQDAADDPCTAHLILEGDLVITSANDLPGSDACLTVTGDLIAEDTDLVDLTGLDLLTEVGGDVYVRDNQHLSQLGELGHLQRIGGDLAIIDNDSLPNAEAMDLLDRVGSENIGGEVRIVNNGAP